MKNIEAYEFKDLSKEVALTVWQREVEERIAFEIGHLDYELENEIITEKEYFNSLNCSKHYAETTGWFVFSYYYEKWKTDIHRIVKDDLQTRLFNVYGTFIQSF